VNLDADAADMAEYQDRAEHSLSSLWFVREF
jgi:hypothetical protein